MSINSCSINEVTIDALCGSRRALIIQTLQGLLPVTPPTTQDRPHQQHINPFRHEPRRSEVEEEIDISTLELPYMTVSIEMMGMKFEQTIERKDEIIPMINIYALAVSDQAELVPQVTINDFKLRVIDDATDLPE